MDSVYETLCGGGLPGFCHRGPQPGGPHGELRRLRSFRPAVALLLRVELCDCRCDALFGPDLLEVGARVAQAAVGSMAACATGTSPPRLVRRSLAIKVVRAPRVSHLRWAVDPRAALREREQENKDAPRGEGDPGTPETETRTLYTETPEPRTPNPTPARRCWPPNTSNRCRRTRRR